MITLRLHLLRLLPFLCGSHRQLALENLALRQQLAVYKRTMPRPRLRTTDPPLVGRAGQSLGRLEGGVGHRDGTWPAYLIEARSTPGMSGCPVFLSLTGLRSIPPTLGLLSELSPQELAALNRTVLS